MASYIYEIIIEISKDSSIKYEFNKEKKCLIVDRFLHGTNVYPGNYGFIPNTLEFDGDPIDVLVWSSQPIIPGCRMKVRVIGALGMIDSGQIDTKIIAIFPGDPWFTAIKECADLPILAREQIVDFFKNYKNLEKKITNIKNWYSAEDANKIIIETQKRFKQ